MTGVDNPPQSAVQSAESVEGICEGSPVSRDTPDCSGPRHASQPVTGALNTLQADRTPKIGASTLVNDLAECFMGSMD